MLRDETNPRPRPIRRRRHGFINDYDPAGITPLVMILSKVSRTRPACVVVTIIAVLAALVDRGGERGAWPGASGAGFCAAADGLMRAWSGHHARR